VNREPRSSTRYGCLASQSCPIFIFDHVGAASEQLLPLGVFCWPVPLKLRQPTTLSYGWVTSVVPPLKFTPANRVQEPVACKAAHRARCLSTAMAELVHISASCRKSSNDPSSSTPSHAHHRPLHRRTPRCIGSIPISQPPPRSPNPDSACGTALRSRSAVS